MPWYSRVSRLFKSDKSPEKAEELYSAVEKGDVKVVKRLLKYSKYFEANNTRKGSWSLVHTAAFAGDKDVLEVVVSKYGNVTMRAEDDLTPLHLAANKGNLAAVKFLLEKGAALDAVTKEHNWTPLHSAILLGHASVVGELLLKKASPDAQDKDGISPLHMAAGWGHEECVKLLLAARAEVDLEDGEKQTPLLRATLRGAKNCMELLVKAGADVEATYYKIDPEGAKEPPSAAVQESINKMSEGDLKPLYTMEDLRKERDRLNSLLADPNLSDQELVIIRRKFGLGDPKPAESPTNPKAPSTVELTEAHKMRAKYPDRIPVIVEQHADSELPKPSRNKFLMPDEISVDLIIKDVLKPSLGVPESTTVILYANDTVQLRGGELMSALYAKYGAPDGFMYIKYK